MGWPGPRGPKGATGVGAPGSDGANGQNAYTTISSFTQPAVLANTQVTVAASSWAQVDQIVFNTIGGYYRVLSIDSPTRITVLNTGWGDYAMPGATVSGSFGPGGEKGPDAYTPTVAADWNNDPPTTFAEALDRIANAIGPIP